MKMMGHRRLAWLDYYEDEVEGSRQHMMMMIVWRKLRGGLDNDGDYGYPVQEPRWVWW